MLDSISVPAAAGQRCRRWLPAGPAAAFHLLMSGPMAGLALSLALGLTLTLTMAPPAAQAQSTPASPANQVTRPDPLDALARVPALRYTSAFASYRPLSEDKPLAWRDANDAVARIGGWRAYAREAQPAEPAPAPAAGHPGHQGHKTP